YVASEKSPLVIVAEVLSGVWSTVADHGPGRAPDAAPAKLPCVDVAVYSNPPIGSEYVVAVAAIAEAGVTTSATAAAKIGNTLPNQRMICPPRAGHLHFPAGALMWPTPAQREPVATDYAGTGGAAARAHGWKTRCDRQSSRRRLPG